MTFSLQRYHWLCLLPLVGGVFVLYTPGLQSVFLLDDHYILRDLATLPSTGITNFIFKGETGPTGRPVALLTFVLQAHHWPDPFWFKLVNLAIHLVNGILIYALCRLICRETLPGNSKKTLFCLLVTGIWLIHPMQMSTVLYVIQRMTLLSTTFMLLAILVYLLSWNSYNRGNRPVAVSGLLVSFAVLVPLAVFNKEIGILTGLYIYSLYLTLLHDRNRDSVWHLTTTVVALVPVVLVLAWYLISTDLSVAYAHRSFTVYDRLLTEPAILFDYLRKILVPLPGHFSLFYDDYPVTRSLLSSPGNLTAVLCVVVLPVLAIHYRKKFPVPAFAVLWFFGGHVLESGFISLELYFEHRNYLPSLGIIYLAVWCLYRFGRLPGLRIAAMGLVIAWTGLILVTALAESVLWSYPVKQAFVWKEHRPQSHRALENLWDAYVSAGRLEKTESVYGEYRRIFPRSIYPMIRRVYEQGCFRKEAVDEREWNSIVESAPAALYQGYSVQRHFYDMLYNHFTGRCKIPDPGRFAGLMVEIARNDGLRHQHAKFYELAAVYSVLSAERERALVFINRAIQYNPSIQNKVFKIRLLSGLGRTAEAASLKDSVRKELQDDYRKKLTYGYTLDRIVIGIDQHGQTNRVE